MIVRVHVGMVRACVVFDNVLDKLETGKSYTIECEVIGAAGILQGHCASAEIFEGLEPFGENIFHAFIALQVNAAYFAGTVVEVEIYRELIAGSIEATRGSIGKMISYIVA